MTRPALVAAALIVAFGVIGAVAAVESDPLGGIAAALIIAAALVVLIAVWIVDSVPRSFRKVREAERFANRNAKPS